MRSSPVDKESQAGELRRRIQAARLAVHGGSGAESRHHWRLDAALAKVDRHHRDCQRRLDDQRSRLKALQHQNTRLRSALHGLLLALESGAGGRDLVEALKRATVALTASAEGRKSAGRRGVLRQVLRRMNRLADAEDRPPTA